MSQERDVTRLVRSWIREDQHESADRILGVVLDRLDTTPQRRSWWPARRSNRVNTYVKLIGAAAAVLLVAVVGYQFLPAQSGGVGGQPTIAPSPSPALLARGTFTVGDDNATELDATGDGANVTGTMTVSDDTGASIAVDLECTLTTEGGLIVIAGTVSQSTMDLFPEGSRFGIMLGRGSPVRAGFVFDETLPGVTCLNYLEGEEGGIDAEAGPGLRPIKGTVELAPER
jgi:hypothetical protein